MSNSSLALTSIIGTLINHPELIDEIKSSIPIKDCLHYELKQIYQEIDILNEQGLSFDKISLLSQIPSNMEHLVLGCINAADLKNLNSHLDIYKHAIIKKNIEELCNKTKEKINEGQNSQDILFDINSGITSLLDKNNTKEHSFAYKDLVSSFLTNLEKKSESETGITGVETGIDGIDNLIGGFQPGDLVIIAARPAMGKTTFGFGIVNHHALKGGRPLVFSLEMPAEQLMSRSFSAIGSIEMEHLKKGKLTEMDLGKLSVATKKVYNMEVEIDDRSSLNPTELRMAIARANKKSEKKVSLILVDYLQLLNGADKGFRPDQKVGEISYISRSLKQIGKDFGVPVIALSQLNRSLEQRADKRPMNSDLRDSGSIEQDADIIIHLYRDEIYNKDTTDKDIAEIIIGKQRNGDIGTVKTKFEGKYSRFSSLDACPKTILNNKQKTIITPPSEGYVSTNNVKAISKESDLFTKTSF